MYACLIRSKIEDKVHKKQNKINSWQNLKLSLEFEFCGQLLNHFYRLRCILNIRTEAIISTHIGKVFPYDKCTNSIITLLQNQCLRWS